MMQAIPFSRRGFSRPSHAYDTKGKNLAASDLRQMQSSSGEPDSSRSGDVGWVSAASRLTRPTKKKTKKRKQNAERRSSVPSRLRAARPARRARLPAFHRGSNRWAFRPAGATSGQASWDAARRSILHCRPDRGAKTSHSSTGVTRARLSQSRDAPPGPVVMPVRMMPEAARARQ
jgi:hypothetical protein